MTSHYDPSYIPHHPRQGVRLASIPNIQPYRPALLDPVVREIVSTHPAHTEIPVDKRWLNQTVSTLRRRSEGLVVLPHENSAATVVASDAHAHQVVAKKQHSFAKLFSRISIPFYKRSTPDIAPPADQPFHDRYARYRTSLSEEDFTPVSPVYRLESPSKMHLAGRKFRRFFRGVADRFEGNW